jgi:hypothetical protein
MEIYRKTILLTNAVVGWRSCRWLSAPKRSTVLLMGVFRPSTMDSPAFLACLFPSMNPIKGSSLMDQNCIKTLSNGLD